MNELDKMELLLQMIPDGPPQSVEDNAVQLASLRRIIDRCKELAAERTRSIADDLDNRNRTSEHTSIGEVRVIRARRKVWNSRLLFNEVPARTLAMCCDLKVKQQLLDDLVSIGEISADTVEQACDVVVGNPQVRVIPSGDGRD